MDPDGEGLGYNRVEDLMREELALEGSTAPKQQRRVACADSNAGSLRNSPMIAAMPPGGRQGTSRGVPQERGFGGSPADHHHRPFNRAALPPPLYHVTLAEKERMIRHATLTHG